MRVLDWSDLDAESRIAVLRRPKFLSSADRQLVREILHDVKRDGDRAVRGLTKMFDRVDLTRSRVPNAQLLKASGASESKVRDATRKACENIEAFHKPQLRTTYSVTVAPGHECMRMVRPLNRVGFYIPGGTAPLLSTVMMLTIPALIAGCRDIVICTPPDSKGEVNSELLALAYRLGITQIFRIGGAQAIAAMAYGTGEVPKVDKIFGPGNSWVTEAKSLVAQDPDGVAIDLPAGPSELLIVVDKTSSPRFVALDVLGQAEHGTDSQVIVVSLDPEFPSLISAEIDKALSGLSREAIARAALESTVFFIVKDIDEVFEIVNRYAPEHLSLQLENAQEFLPLVHCAGSVFCGPWTPVAAGDYASGTNHVLPTGGYARSISGLGVEAFQRTISVQTLSAGGLKALSPVVETLANLEGLQAHASSVRGRVDELRSQS